MGKKSAAVVPLNYEYHFEHAVAIVDTDWNRLEELLLDPNRYLHRVKARYKLIGSSDGVGLPWMVNEPAVAILTPMNKSLLMVAHALKSSDATGVQSGGTTLERAEQALNKIVVKPDFKSGFFVVMFAIDTAVIHVGYLPPDKYNAKYKGGFTKPTLSKCGSAGVSCVSAHVDLAEPAQGTSIRKIRAEFVIDLVSDYQGFLDMINDAKGYLVETEMVDDTPTASGSAPPLPVAAQPVVSEPVSSLYRLDGIPTWKGRSLPTVTVDGLQSTDEPGTPCVWPKGFSSTTDGNLTIVETEDVVVKFYPAPPKPPTT